MAVWDLIPEMVVFLDLCKRYGGHYEVLDKDFCFEVGLTLGETSNIRSSNSHVERPESLLSFSRFRNKLLIPFLGFLSCPPKHSSGLIIAGLHVLQVGKLQAWPPPVRLWV